MEKLKWKDLSPLQIGKYSEYIAKMEFILYGFDVYSPELGGFYKNKGKVEEGECTRKLDTMWFLEQVKPVF